MTEDEWLTCNDPRPMLEFVRGTASARKLRLFACGCCRHLQDQVPDEPFLEAVEVGERFADGGATKAALKRARRGVAAARHALPAGRPEHHVEWVALWLSEVTASENAYGSVADEVRRLAALGLLPPDKEPPTLSLIRDIFGNPFNPVALDPAWLITDVVGLARTIYDDRAFQRMPELADALDGAGCRDAQVLAHLRQPGEHVRGCWVLDLVLGKS